MRSLRPFFLIALLSVVPPRSACAVATYADVSPHGANGETLGATSEIATFEFDDESGTGTFDEGLEKLFDAFAGSKYGPIDTTSLRNTQFFGIIDPTQHDAVVASLRRRGIPFADGQNVVVLTPEQKRALDGVFQGAPRGGRNPAQAVEAPESPVAENYRDLPTRPPEQSLERLHGIMNEIRGTAEYNHYLGAREEFWKGQLGRLKRRWVYAATRLVVNTTGGTVTKLGLVGHWATPDMMGGGYKFATAIFAGMLGGTINFFGEQFWKRIEYQDILSTDLKNAVIRLKNVARKRSGEPLLDKLLYKVDPKNADKLLRSTGGGELLKMGVFEFTLNGVVESFATLLHYTVFTGLMMLDSHGHLLLPHGFEMAHTLMDMSITTAITMPTQIAMENTASGTFRNRSAYYQVITMALNSRIHAAELEGNLALVEELTRDRNFALRRAMRMTDIFNGLVVAGSFAWMLSGAIPHAILKYGPLTVLGAAALAIQQYYRPEDVLDPLPPTVSENIRALPARAKKLRADLRDEVRGPPGTGR